jgi:lipopolysaccharide assembly outer membrane protein LptD (OstA)
MAAFFIVLYPIYLAAQEDSGPLILEHADKLESSNANGDIVNLIGNVHFYHDKADLYSQRATWYQASGLIQFVDSVVVTEQGRRLTAQTVTYYRRDRRITALNDVVLVDSAQDMQLHCQRADYFRNNKQLDATGAPELILNPSDDTSRMVIDAHRLTYFGADSYGSAYDSVVIIRHDMIAHAGQADFYRNPERAILYKDPDIINGQNKLSGDTISIFTESRKLNKVLVQDNAKAIYKALPDTAVAEYTTAEIDGRQLEAFFGDDKIQLMVSRQNATSLYAPAVTDTLIRGTNVASGDSITLFFNDGTIKRVYISGGAQGEFIEPKFTGEGKGYFDTTRYSADEIDYNFDNSEIDLSNNGAMHYHDMALTAGRIRYETNTRILVAEGLSTDSSDDKYQPPVLKQGTEELHGDKMSYNIDTRKGQVRMARTKYENGYYSGETLRQASENELLVSQGNYSSCDKEVDPHYHFHSNRMKMINKDKVIARPVILYIGDLPVFAIPYYVFPIRKGRHSGFLPFELGSFRGGSGSRFIRNLGYYWAASDYYDLLGSLDFYENSHTTINGSLRYRLIYKLNGVVTVNYTHQGTWDLVNYIQRVSNSWRISYSHSQILSQTMTLGGSGTFVSNKNYIAQNVYDPAERLNRTITSDFNLTKAWPEQSISMYVQARQDWNLDTDEKTQSLPSFSISRSRLPLFPPASRSKKETRVRPDEVVEEPTNRWYNSIYFDISSSGQNYRQRFKSDSTFFQKNYQTINTRSSISLSSKFFGFLNVSPNVGLTHSLVRLEPGELPDSLGLPTRKFVTRLLYNTGVSVNASVFGTVYPNKFGIIGLRHTMTPSISYSFTPAITKNRRYFSYVGGGTGSTRAKSLSYSLANSFQAKYKSGEEEKKIDLFYLNFNGSYNMAARDRNLSDLKLSDLSSSLRTAAIPNMSLEFRTTHSFYDLYSTHKRPLFNPRMTSMNIAAGLTGGYHAGGGGGEDKENDVSKIKAFGAPPAGPAGAANLGIDFNLTYNFSNNRSTGKSVKTQWIDVGTQIQPTQNWRVEYNCHYDIVNKQISSQELDLTRDMHCWQASFMWIPSGVISGYYARISIKTLPDIKFESSRGGVGQRGGFNY